LTAWAGIDWDPFRPDEVRVYLYRVALPDGSVGCDIEYLVRADALRRLGLDLPQRGQLTE